MGLKGHVVPLWNKVIFKRVQQSHSNHRENTQQNNKFD